MDRQKLIDELHDRAAMHQQARKEAIAKGDMAAAAYLMGRVDQCYADAGCLAQMVDDHALSEGAAEQAMEYLDSWKHGGDTSVLFAGR